MWDSSISVAMTTFNGAKHLGDQLTSLSAQTVKPLELIICDDGSTDESVAILRSFSTRAPFEVKIFRNAERLGYQRNFMKAASLCKGSLIAFCDQDDIWNENKLALVNKYFMQSGNLLLAHDYCIFFEDGSPMIQSFFGYLALSGFLPVVNVKGCSLILRRELLKLVNWPSPQSNLSHDTWVCFAALMLEKHGCIMQSLMRHRIHGNNASAKIPVSKGNLHRFLRRFRLPPFANCTDLEAFIAANVWPSDLPFYTDAVRQCGLAMTEDQRRRALSDLEKRRAICDFILGEDYLHPVRRTLAAIRLFLTHAYRDADGIFGFLQDIFGRRTWMR